jgi:hypothetical protein
VAARAKAAETRDPGINGHGAGYAGEKVTVFPNIMDGKNWSPMSFDPQTGLAYVTP